MRSLESRLDRLERQHDFGRRDPDTIVFRLVKPDRTVHEVDRVLVNHTTIMDRHIEGPNAETEAEFLERVQVEHWLRLPPERTALWIVQQLTNSQEAYA